MFADALLRGIAS